MTSVGTASTSAPVSAARRSAAASSPAGSTSAIATRIPSAANASQQCVADAAGGAGDDGHPALELRDHSFLKMSEPPAIIAITTPAPVTATMTSAVAATTG